jgi:hypothetical protein
LPDYNVFAGVLCASLSPPPPSGLFAVLIARLIGIEARARYLE